MASLVWCVRPEYIGIPIFLHIFAIQKLESYVFDFVWNCWMLVTSWTIEHFAVSQDFEVLLGTAQICPFLITSAKQSMELVQIAHFDRCSH